MEEVLYSTSCPDSVNEALLCLLAAPKLHTLELTPRNMTLAPEHMHVLGELTPILSLDMLDFAAKCLIRQKVNDACEAPVVPARCHPMHSGALAS